MDEVRRQFALLPKATEGHWIEDHYPIVEEIINYVKPKEILEIGFNAGHSAIMWLTASTANLTSVDIGRHSYTEPAAQIIKKHFPERFKFIKQDSQKVQPQLKQIGTKYDLIMIDGGHHYKICLNDLNLAKTLKIKYVVVDDAIRNKLVTNAVNDFKKQNQKFTLIKEWPTFWGVQFYNFENMPRLMEIPKNKKVFISDLYEKTCKDKAKYACFYMQYINDLSQYWLKYGLMVVNEIDNADYVICSTRNYKTNQKYFANKNVILIECEDAAIIHEPDLLKCPNVKLYIKGTILDPPINKLVDKYHHYLYLQKNAESKVVNPKPIPSAQLSKVVCLFPHGYRWKDIVNIQLSLKDNKMPELNRRQYDIACVGTSQYNAPCVTEHRKNAIRSILNLPDHLKTATSNFRIVRTVYYSLLKNTKLFLSPQGYGEWSHKDFEAILHGAILIKPMNHVFKSYPNIYQPGITCLKCKVDYSDLPQVIDTALKDIPQLKKMQQTAFNLVKQYLDMNLLSKEFCFTIQKIAF